MNHVTQKKNFWILFTCTIIFILSIVGNYLTSSDNNRVKLVSDQFTSLITPASWVFSIWGGIYIFAIGNLIYWWVLFIKNDKGLTQYYREIFIFAWISLLNALWLYLWVDYQIPLSWVVIMLMGLSLHWETNNLEYSFRKKHYMTKMFFHIYYAWILIAISLNTLVVLRFMGFNILNFTMLIMSMIVLVFLSLLALFYLKIQGRKEYTLVLIWALVGIMLNRHRNLHGGLIVYAIIFLITVLMSVLVHENLVRVRIYNKEK